MKTGSQKVREPRRPLRGIVITRGDQESASRRPRIAAFIWGGKVRPNPTLPFGRWKGAA
jgi:hypothetical protein